MSRVVSAELVPYRLRLRSAHRDARGGFAAREGVLLKLSDECGRVGLGDCAPLPPVTPPLDVCCRALVAEAERLPGTDPVSGFPELMAAPDAGLPTPARAAVEMALGWLAAQELGIPLGGLLASDSPVRPARLAVNALADAADVAEAIAQAARFSAEGYTVFKVKVGLGADRDAVVLRGLRDRIGPGAVTRIDANGAWSPAEFAAMAPLLHAAGVDIVEQPVAPGVPPAEWARLRWETGLRIAADESLADGARGLELIRAKACDAVVLKPSLLGLAAAARVARAAREAGLEVIVSGAFESGAGFAAALEFAAALGSPGAAHGFATALAVLDDPVSGVPLPSAGGVELPAAGVLPALAPAESAREALT